LLMKSTAHFTLLPQVRGPLVPVHDGRPDDDSAQFRLPHNRPNLGLPARPPFWPEDNDGDLDRWVTDSALCPPGWTFAAAAIAKVERAFSAILSFSADFTPMFRSLSLFGFSFTLIGISGAILYIPVFKWCVEAAKWVK
jgi:hypothetical protein